MEFVSISKAKKMTNISYLGLVNVSAKLTKNGKVGQSTYGLYLSPAKLSGYQTCSHSTPECRMGCLNTSGLAAVEIFAGKNKIANARANKTKLLFEHQDFFMQWLIADIKASKNLAEKKGMGFSVRLNCTSDIDWANVKFKGQNIFEIFSDVQFYDYTKNVNKFDNIAPNYHLTYSYTGRNWSECLNVLKQGHNIAMVFNVKKESDIPTDYKGFEVINGDVTDYRVKDKNGVIVGLKWKRIANREAEKMVLNSCFVVSPQKTEKVPLKGLKSVAA